ncbi:MAG: dienelactone hydrolase family protein [Gammaproteobacteria bacterium]|nr:dienelactone hydrolase family protein [Gammaproteobacteria bacterium]
MSIQTRLVDYGSGDSAYRGMLAWDDSLTGPRPAVLVAHTIRGRTEFEDEKALRLAELGYVGFAADVYGVAETGTDAARNRENMEKLKADRVELQRRISLSFSTMLEQAGVDTKRTAAIGYCFGGMCVLDLARIETPVNGVASFHGLFEAPGNTDGNRVSASILALHGWDDPLATPDSVVALGEELTGLGADWQVHGYGNTVHAFTNPAANNDERGTVYNSMADRRSWLTMKNFLNELFEPSITE